MIGRHCSVPCAEDLGGCNTRWRITPSEGSCREEMEGSGRCFHILPNNTCSVCAEETLLNSSIPLRTVHFFRHRVLYLPPHPHPHPQRNQNWRYRNILPKAKGPKGPNP